MVPNSPGGGRGYPMNRGVLKLQLPFKVNIHVILHFQLLKKELSYISQEENI